MEIIKFSEKKHFKLLGNILPLKDTNDYKQSKTPISFGWNKPGYNDDNVSIDKPFGIHYKETICAIDIDNNIIAELIFNHFKKQKFNFGLLQTKKGKQFIFRNTSKIGQGQNFLHLFGFIYDVRTNRGYSAIRLSDKLEKGGGLRNLSIVKFQKGGLTEISKTIFYIKAVLNNKKWENILEMLVKEWFDGHRINIWTKTLMPSITYLIEHNSLKSSQVSFILNGIFDLLDRPHWDQLKKQTDKLIEYIKENNNKITKQLTTLAKKDKKIDQNIYRKLSIKTKDLLEQNKWVDDYIAEHQIYRKTSGNYPVFMKIVKNTMKIVEAEVIKKDIKNQMDLWLCDNRPFPQQVANDMFNRIKITNKFKPLAGKIKEHLRYLQFNNGYYDLFTSNFYKDKVAPLYVYVSFDYDLKLRNNIKDFHNTKIFKLREEMKKQKWFNEELFDLWCAQQFDIFSKDKFALLFKGASQLGKSTLIDFFSSLVGFEHAKMMSMKDIADKFGNVGLIEDAILIFDGENEQEHTLDNSKLKKLISNETIIIEPKGKDKYEARPFGVCMWSTNGITKFSGMSSQDGLGFRIIEVHHETKLFGGSAPQWFTESFIETKKADKKDYIEFCLFMRNMMGKDKNYKRIMNSNPLFKNSNIVKNSNNINEFLDEIKEVDNPYIDWYYLNKVRNHLHQRENEDKFIYHSSKQKNKKDWYGIEIYLLYNNYKNSFPKFTTRLSVFKESITNSPIFISLKFIKVNNSNKCFAIFRNNFVEKLNENFKWKKI